MQTTDFTGAPVTNAGKGPKGFVRADNLILDSIGVLLTADPFIDASTLTVDVKKGEVSVTGGDSCHPVLKLRVQQIISLVPGVTAINFVEEPKSKSK